MFYRSKMNLKNLNQTNTTRNKNSTFNIYLIFWTKQLTKLKILKSLT